VLTTYGYPETTHFKAYFGGNLGLEWYALSPHYALSVYGGVRDYPDAFARTGDSRTPLAWLSGASVRYTF
jgi:hypothetical protein